MTSTPAAFASFAPSISNSTCAVGGLPGLNSGFSLASFVVSVIF
jgi:hypothetical protein